jgi:hypothetical protein
LTFNAHRRSHRYPFVQLFNILVAQANTALTDKMPDTPRPVSPMDTITAPGNIEPQKACAKNIPCTVGLPDNSPVSNRSGGITFSNCYSILFVYFAVIIELQRSVRNFDDNRYTTRRGSSRLIRKSSQLMVIPIFKARDANEQAKNKQ